MSKKSLVKNAADSKQVHKAKREVINLDLQNKNDLKFLLKSIEGRRFLWRLLGHCGAFSSVWEPSARIHYNAGKQDVGHFLLAEITNADSEGFLKMMQENKENGDEK